MSARDDVLARVAEALGRGPRGSQPGEAERVGVPEVPRDYAGAGAPGRPEGPELLDLLVDRLEDYRASVHRCTAATVADTVAAQVGEHALTSLVVPPGADPAWTAALPEQVRRLADEPPLDVEALDAIDGTLSGCAVAIASTGTLVLDTGPGQGRRALSLVPDWLLVVVHAEQVVAGVPDAVARLDPLRPLTWISGPSATSDIELQRVEGVHGPRTLVVVLVEE